MSASYRQSELFSGQVWTAMYQSMSQINFNASDFDTIRAAMINYITLNYPEEFNDWVESSEFVALIDLIAYLGGSLAFRVDINAQENFMDTAQSAESILKLARILSYVPTRNYPGNGLLKVTAISTDDDVIDSSGNNLNSATIVWNDAQNINWYEQFILVLNSAFVSTNPFGQPTKTGTVGSIPTQMYTFNSMPEIGNLYSFTAKVEGNSLPFEIVNLDFKDGGTFSEKMPDPLAAFNIAYTNDGNGNGSSNTGFFLYFKQGQLLSTIYEIDTPIQNRVIDVNVQNINQLDVWVQSVDVNGFITSGGSWTPVQSVVNNLYSGDNITYNSLSSTIQNIYNVTTRANDQISLRFSDGYFGKIPVGLIRCYYRVSSGTYYTANPQDLSSVNIVIPYYNNNGVQHNLSVTLSLQQSINNSAPAESESSIKLRAPSVYYSQNRMVSGQDYNTFPTQNNLAVKLTALNRVYSGQSRFIDLNDPTGTYQDVNVFSDDGIIFNDYEGQYFELPQGTDINSTSTSLLNDLIQPFLQTTKMSNFIWDQYLLISDAVVDQNGGPWLIWQQASGTNETSTGTFYTFNFPSGTSTSTSYLYLPTDSDIGNPLITPKTISNSITPSLILQPVGLQSPTTTPNMAKYVSEGAMIKFMYSGWVSVSSVSGDGTGIVSNNIGRVRLSSPIKTNDYIVQVIPAFRRTFNSQETTAILSALNSKISFGIGFSFIDNTYYIISGNNMAFTSPYNYSSRNTSTDASWLISIQYSINTFRVEGRGLLYVFESTQNCDFYLYNSSNTYDSITGQLSNDTINVLGVNSDPSTLFAKPWRTFTAYSLGNYILYRNSTYTCVYAHTSGSAFTTMNGVTLLWEIVSPSIGTDLAFTPSRPFYYRDGYIEPRRIQVVFSQNTNNNNLPNNPESFYQIVNQPLMRPSQIINNKTYTFEDENSPQWLFWQQYVNVDNYIYYTLSNINPVRVYAVFTTYVNIQQNTSLAQPVIIGNIGGLSTVINPSHVPNGSWILLTGQLQFYQNTPSPITADYTARVNENHKIYQYSYNSATGVGSLTPVTDFNGMNNTIIWNFKGDFWLQNPVPDSNGVLEYKADKNNTYIWYLGRKNIKFQWKHYCNPTHRIDPAVTNIIDIFVLTTAYDTAMRLWVYNNQPVSALPAPPSQLDLQLMFENMEQYKMFSDEIVWRPLKYKLIYGSRAPENLQVKFKAVMLNTSTYSSGEAAAQIITALNEYFVASNWDAGETVFWSETAAYIHLRCQNIISSIVIVPMIDQDAFGDLFEIPCLPDEIPLCCATVSDVQIILSNTQTNLKIKY